METFCGIYEIVNTVSGRRYIGSSRNTRKRWLAHAAQLRRGKHHCIQLQRAWNVHGETSFIFRLIRECTEAELEDAERAHLVKFFPTGELYNSNDKVSGGDLVTNHPNRDGILRKRNSSAEKTMMLKGSAKRDQVYGRPGAMNGMYGRGHSKEVIEKARKRALGNDWAKYKVMGQSQRKALSEFAKTRTGNKNPFYGRTHSEETKAKIAAKKVGSVPANARKVRVDGVEYASVAEAGRVLGLSAPTVLWRLNSNNKKFKGYEFV